MSRILISGVVLSLVLMVCVAADRPARIGVGGDSIAALSKARIEVAADGLQFAKKQYQAGVGDYRIVNHWQRKWIDARLDSAEGKELRLAILAESVAAIKDEEARVEKMYQAGLQTVTQLDVATVKFDRVDAELRLAKLRAE